MSDRPALLLVLVLLLLLSTVACATATGDGPADAGTAAMSDKTAEPAAAEPAVYGDGVDLADTTPIGDIVADPEAWAGKTVRVEGKVTGVCPKKGCWMELASPDDHHLRIKVEDDVIVFPAEAEGHRAVAQGTVEVKELSRDQYVDWQRHLAEEQGEDFDEASVGEGPYRLVQVKGTGAKIASGS